MATVAELKAQLKALQRMSAEGRVSLDQVLEVTNAINAELDAEEQRLAQVERVENPKENLLPTTAEEHFTSEKLNPLELLKDALRPGAGARTGPQTLDRTIPSELQTLEGEEYVGQGIPGGRAVQGSGATPIDVMMGVADQLGIGAPIRSTLQGAAQISEPPVESTGSTITDVLTMLKHGADMGVAGFVRQAAPRTFETLPILQESERADPNEATAEELRAEKEKSARLEMGSSLLALPVAAAIPGPDSAVMNKVGARQVFRRAAARGVELKEITRLQEAAGEFRPIADVIKTPGPHGAKQVVPRKKPAELLPLKGVDAETGHAKAARPTAHGVVPVNPRATGPVDDVVRANPANTRLTELTQPELKAVGLRLNKHAADIDVQRLKYVPGLDGDKANRLMKDIITAELEGIPTNIGVNPGQDKFVFVDIAGKRVFQGPSVFDEDLANSYAMTILDEASGLRRAITDDIEKLRGPMAQVRGDIAETRTLDDFFDKTVGSDVQLNANGAAKLGHLIDDAPYMADNQIERQARVLMRKHVLNRPPAQLDKEAIRAAKSIVERAKIDRQLMKTWIPPGLPTRAARVMNGPKVDPDGRSHFIKKALTSLFTSRPLRMFDETTNGAGSELYRLRTVQLKAAESMQNNMWLGLALDENGNKLSSIWKLLKWDIKDDYADARILKALRNQSVKLAPGEAEVVSELQRWQREIRRRQQLVGLSSRELFDEEIPMDVTSTRDYIARTFSETVDDITAASVYGRKLGPGKWERIEELKQIVKDAPISQKAMDRGFGSKDFDYMADLYTGAADFSAARREGSSFMRSLGVVPLMWRGAASSFASVVHIAGQNFGLGAQRVFTESFISVLQSLAEGRQVRKALRAGDIDTLSQLPSVRTGIIPSSKIRDRVSNDMRRFMRSHGEWDIDTEKWHGRMADAFLKGVQQERAEQSVRRSVQIGFERAFKRKLAVLAKQYAKGGEEALDPTILESAAIQMNDIDDIAAARREILDLVRQKKVPQKFNSDWSSATEYLDRVRTRSVHMTQPTRELDFPAWWLSPEGKIAMQFKRSIWKEAELTISNWMTQLKLLRNPNGNVAQRTATRVKVMSELAAYCAVMVGTGWGIQKVKEFMAAIARQDARVAQFEMTDFLEGQFQVGGVAYPMEVFAVINGDPRNGLLDAVTPASVSQVSTFFGTLMGTGNPLEATEAVTPFNIPYVGTPPSEKPLRPSPVERLFGFDEETPASTQ